MFDKGSKNTTSTQNTSYNGTQTETPNNLSFLQSLWNTGQNMFNTNNGQNLITQGTTDLTNANAPATTAATTGATSLSGIANGTTGGFANNPTNANLAPYASGAYLNTNNPSFQALMGHIANATQAATDGSFAASGRYGSGANANAFDSAVTNAGSRLGYQNYTDQQHNQIDANQLLSGNYTTGTGQQVAAGSQLPAAVQALLTPGTTSTTAGYAPLSAYIAALTSGNGGRTATSNGTQNSTGTQNTSGSNFGFRLY